MTGSFESGNGRKNVDKRDDIYIDTVEVVVGYPDDALRMNLHTSVWKEAKHFFCSLASI